MSDHVKIEWGDEPERRAARELEIVPKANDPVRPITKPCARQINWLAIGVMAFDFLLWIGVISFLTWAASDWPALVKAWK